MKTKLFIMALIAVALSACKDRTKFTLEGKFDGAQNGGKVYFFGDSAGTMYQDSTVLSEKGEFIFTHTAQKPTLYKIVYADKQYTVVAENGDQVSFKADPKNPDGAYDISGSENTRNVTKYNEFIAVVIKRFKEIDQKYGDQLKKDRDNGGRNMTAILAGFHGEVDKINKDVLDYINTNPNSPLGNDAYQYIFINTGIKAPDFTMYSIDGKTVSLSQFKGKYVLLDMWASWCMPCRAENPNIVKAYNKFKDKNFTVLGISLDDDMEAWKAAVKADGLTWAQGSELKRWDGSIVKLYQLNSIPASFLIDPNGTIIARDLREEDLHRFLEDTLK